MKFNAYKKCICFIFPVIYKIIFNLLLSIINLYDFNSYDVIRYGYKYNFNYNKYIGCISYKNRIY